VADKTITRPLRIGLTGGIASGKSVVARMFADLGVPVIDTDVIAREVVAPGQPALEEISQRFGKRMIDAGGNLNRKALRKLVFSDDQARMDLEAILHPRIGTETRRQAEAAGGDYQIIVVPLLVGSALREFVHRVLLVDCDKEIQVQRLLARDAENIEQAHKILAAQASREDRLAIADDIINNNGSLDQTRASVDALARQYQRLADRRVRR
jgi:dephospho-CoA kinase